MRTAIILGAIIIAKSINSETTSKDWVTLVLFIACFAIWDVFSEINKK